MRRRKYPTFCSRGHELNEKNLYVYANRDAYHCKVCNRNAHAEWCSKNPEKRRKRFPAKKKEKIIFVEENPSVVEQKMAIAERLYRLRRFAA